MGLFDIFKAFQNEKTKSVTNDLGTFFLVEAHRTKEYQGSVKSKIDDRTKIHFPPENGVISNYQIEYFRRIENNWNSILNQLKFKIPRNEFSEMKISNILIPDKENDDYDMDAEIVFDSKGDYISVILADIDVDEVIQI